MRLTFVLALLGVVGAVSLPAQLPTEVPMMHTAQPDRGKIGSVLRIDGSFLGKAKVDEVYLSDHTFDMKVKVLDQTDDSIEIRIPPFVKPGRLQLVVKTAGNQPLILEQPVYITVEEPKKTLKATAKAAPPDNGTH